jgi:hypothetical protein
MSGSDGKFAIGTEYVVKATLTPNPGYTFAGLANNSFTYGGAATVVTNAGSGVMVITFPALGKAWFVANYGIDTPGNGLSSETPFKTVNKALAEIAIDHGDGSPLTRADIVVIGTPDDRRTILIDNTANIYPPITLRGLSPTQQGILTADKDGWTNPTLPFAAASVANAYRVMEITTGAKVTLGNDLTITGGGQRAEVEYGAGVYVHDNGIDFPFIMNGGTITGNRAYKGLSGTGGGVYVRYTSAMIMNGGIISDNSSYRTGGVAATNESTFTMTGGVITNNDSVQAGAGVRVAGTTVSTFTMSGGVISANKATEGYSGGVYVGGSGRFIMSGGTVSGNTSPGSGGVWLNGNGIFVMDGGTISGNIAPLYGGGIGLVDTASFTMNGGIISGNTAGSGGGGVAVQSGTAIFKKEPLVSGGSSGIIYGNDGGDNSNTATSAATLLQGMGHAVYISDTMKRETTVLPDQSLDSTVSGADGGWVE